VKSVYICAKCMHREGGREAGAEIVREQASKTEREREKGERDAR
jgi:hypothetical protein